MTYTIGDSELWARHGTSSSCSQQNRRGEIRLRCGLSWWSKRRMRLRHARFVHFRDIRPRGSRARRLLSLKEITTSASPCRLAARCHRESEYERLPSRAGTIRYGWRIVWFPDRGSWFNMMDRNYDGMSIWVPQIYFTHFLEPEPIMVIHLNRPQRTCPQQVTLRVTVRTCER